MEDKGSRCSGRVHEAEGLGRIKLLCRWLGGVKDWCAVDVGEGMLDKGNPEPIDEGGRRRPTYCLAQVMGTRGARQHREACLHHP